MVKTKHNREKSKIREVVEKAAAITIDPIKPMTADEVADTLEAMIEMKESDKGKRSKKQKHEEDES